MPTAAKLKPNPAKTQRRPNWSKPTRSVFGRLFGSSPGYTPAKLSRIRAGEQRLKDIKDQEIVSQSVALQERSAEKGADQSVQVEFASLIAEAVRRTFGFRLHDVQIRGFLECCGPTVAEMRTGEGKTVVTAAAAAMNILTAENVHVATTNAYLAGRDYEETAPLFERLGISSGILPEGQDVPKAKQAYESQITYGPGYQFGFDYLRDQVFLRTNRQSTLGQRTINSIQGRDLSANLMQTFDVHATMLVDEADSVMIDEAVVPLVISGAARGFENSEPFDFALQIAQRLEQDKDFKIESPGNLITVLKSAEENCHELIADKDFDLARPWRIYISNALRAIHVLKRNKDYVVRDGEVQIVDQYTGRIFSDRTWQDGLHQAVEGKEGLQIKSAPPSVARVTRQNYFKLYEQLTGLTGTATQVINEFRSVYGVKTVCIPTNLPCIRKQLPYRFFADLEAKIAGVAADTENRHRTRQPILIGTRTIAESIQISDALKAKGLDAVVLNGLQDEGEAEIVALAGLPGTITIATNMAGRGTDIKVPDESQKAGGLHVIGFSPNESYRIDRQLAGRAARQGQPGSVQFFVSSDDEVISEYGKSLGRKIKSRAHSNGETKTSFTRELGALQEKIEQVKYENRMSLMRKDRWMDLVRETIDQE